MADGSVCAKSELVHSIFNSHFSTNDIPAEALSTLIAGVEVSLSQTASSLMWTA